MSQLAQDDNGDLLIGNNSFSIIEGQAEVRQRIIQNLKTFLEEWFLDITIGLPYLQLIFVKGTPDNIISDYFKSEIIKTIGVTELTKFDPMNLIGSTRELEVNFEVKTSYSEKAIKIQEGIL